MISFNPKHIFEEWDGTPLIWVGTDTARKKQFLFYHIKEYPFNEGLVSEYFTTPIDEKEIRQLLLKIMDLRTFLESKQEFGIYSIAYYDLLLPQESWGTIEKSTLLAKNVFPEYKQYL